VSIPSSFFALVRPLFPTPCPLTENGSCFYLQSNKQSAPPLDFPYIFHFFFRSFSNAITFFFYRPQLREFELGCSDQNNVSPPFFCSEHFHDGLHPPARNNVSVCSNFLGSSLTILYVSIDFFGRPLSFLLCQLPPTPSFCCGRS